MVGAGFAGSILAERLAVAGGRRVLLIDQRDHIAGNAYDYVDEHGVLVHKYGPHIFHTNAGKVVDYLSRFTDWRPYEHRVRAWVEGQLVPIPINRTTVNELYGLDLQTDEQVAGLLRRARRADRLHPHQRGRGGLEGRPRPLREVLPRLHAQAVEPRSLAAARVGGVAHPDAHEHRRPLLHRQLPEDAGRGLHGDVRADGRPPADRAAARRRTSSPCATSCAAGTSSSPGRSTATSTAATASCLPLAGVRAAHRGDPGRRARPARRARSTSRAPRSRTRARRSSGTSRASGCAHSTLIVEYPRDEGDPTTRSRATTRRRSTSATRRWRRPRTA